MSHTPAFVMGGLCVVGGIIGFARTHSLPSLIAGTGVGALYLWSGNTIQTTTTTQTGQKGAFAASVILFLSSAPRFGKGPVPATLTVASAASTVYYANAVFNLGWF